MSSNIHFYNSKTASAWSLARLVYFSGEITEIKPDELLKGLTEDAKNLITGNELNTENKFTDELKLINDFINSFPGDSEPINKHKATLKSEAENKIGELKNNYKSEIEKRGALDNEAKLIASNFKYQVDVFRRNLSDRYHETRKLEVEYLGFVNSKNDGEKRDLMKPWVNSILQEELKNYKAPENARNQPELVEYIVQIALPNLTDKKTYKDFEKTLKEMLGKDKNLIQQAMNKMLEEMPKMEAKKDEIDLIKTVLGEDEIKAKFGTDAAEIGKMAAILATELEIAFDKNKKPIGYVTMIKGVKNCDVGELNKGYQMQTGNEPEIKNMIRELAKEHFDGKSKTKLESLEGKLAAKAKELKDERTEIAQGIGTDNEEALEFLAKNDSQESKEFIALVDQSRAYRESNQWAPNIAVARAMTEEIQNSTAEIDKENSMDQLMSQTAGTQLRDKLQGSSGIDFARNNPHFQRESWVQELAELIRQMLGDKNYKGVQETLEDVNGGKDTIAIQKKAKENYLTVLNSKNPDLDALLEAYNNPNDSKTDTLFAVAEGQPALPNPDIGTERHKGKRAEAAQEYIGKNLEIRISKIEGNKITFKKKEGDEEFMVQIEKKDNKIIATQLIDNKPAGQAIDATKVALAQLPKAEEIKKENDRRNEFGQALTKMIEQGKPFAKKSELSPLGKLINSLNKKEATKIKKQKYEGDAIVKQTALDTARMEYIKTNYETYKDKLEDEVNKEPKTALAQALDEVKKQATASAPAPAPAPAA